LPPKALEIKPDYYEAYYGIGVAYASSNKFKEAIKAYKKAIEIKPSHKAYYNMGTVYFRLGKYQKALEGLNLKSFFISLNCLLKLI
jgi:tetratricopeptide (TPR) repeat protein